MGKIILRKNEELRIKEGHPWVFNNEIANMDGNMVSGDIVDVYSFDRQFLGKAFLNTFSKIFARMITRTENQIDEEYFRQAIRDANQKRLDLGYTDHYRVVFGEADFIPGFIVDKYGEYLSVQFLCLGVDIRKQMFVNILVELFKPKGIFERSDVSVREKEGLSQVKQVLYGEVPEHIILSEDEVFLDVDIINGQKTGLFLDQSKNHLLVKEYAKGKTVLDCFSHQGQFALHAKKAGACSVEAVDISEYACERIKANALLNKLDIQVTKSDVFELLRKYQDENKKFDIIILDPPAFTKSKNKVENAYRGYKEINMQAMKLLNSGGILMTASCSQHMTPALFLQMLEESKNDVGKKAQMIDFRIQSSDHPTLLGSEENLYLKLVVLRIF